MKFKPEETNYKRPNRTENCQLDIGREHKWRRSKKNWRYRMN
jgi:hypothetical protein